MAAKRDLCYLSIIVARSVQRVAIQESPLADIGEGSLNRNHGEHKDRMDNRKPDHEGGPHTGVILDSIADGVFTVDRERNVTSFNRAAEAITGVSRKQAIGQKCSVVFRADICQSNCPLCKTMEGGREWINLRVNILSHKGKPIPISISTAALRNRNGEIVGGVETFRDLSDVEILRNEVRGRYTFASIVSKNHEMRQIIDVLPDIAASDSTVLIEGPSGSGKELLARAIHDLSLRRKGKMVCVNCGALPDTLLESELFGYMAGAFTDAKKNKLGRFALAQGGTLFLDEIGDVSAALQVKLLRVLEEKEFEPLGATAPVKANARIVSATNRNLSDLVARGVFREDLYYRLKVVRIALPPLSRRREDIPLLADHFIARFAALKGKPIERIDDEALAILMRHDFAGNIRELANIIEYAFVLCRGNSIELRHLPQDLFEKTLPVPAVPEVSCAKNPLQEAEYRAITEALRRHNGNRRKTASDLGINKTTLWRKMKKLGITFP